MPYEVEGESPLISAVCEHLRNSMLILYGRHTPWAGAANQQGGVTIDLSKFSQLDISKDQKQISIGAGRRWEDVYLKLDALGLATSGGRVASVGVAGLTLGGGISFFSPRYGLVCDNVINFQVVLASGKLVNANAQTNPDLFKALKGGSNNFGVVTRFDMKLFTQGKFWGGFIGQDISTRQQQYDYFVTFASSKTYDPYAALIMSFAYSLSTGWYIASNFEYTKPQAYPATFKNFTDLPQTFNTMRISNLTDFTVELLGKNPPGSRELFVTATFKNDAASMARFFDIANATLTPFKTTPNLTVSLSYQPFPQIVTSKGFPTAGNPNSGNSLGIDATRGDLTNVLLTVQWADPAADKDINDFATALFQKTEDANKKAGTYDPYLYLNYAAQEQDPIQGYGDASLQFLTAVSKKFDPLQVFQRFVPGGFKLQKSGLV